MILVGIEFLTSLAKQGGFSAKMVFNANGAIFFPAELQHRDRKTQGISYEDNYAGNALAAMLSPGRIEIRFHQAFSDQRVCGIIGSLLARPELSFMKSWRITYQGRQISLT